MKISVITPSYNSGDTIEKAINSVLDQNYSNYEHIIIDGASTDNTIEILKSYPHLKWASESDGGQVEAMNKGFSVATGDVIVYLNADDYFMKGAFRKVIPHLRKGAKVVMGKVLVRTQNGDNIQEWINDPRVDLESMLHHWEPDAFCVNPVGYFYHREVKEKILFNEENDDKHDLEFLLEVGRCFKIKKINFILGVFNHTQTTKTAREQLMPSYWRRENFPFLDRFIQKMSGQYQRLFNLDRDRGYQLRRHWTVKEAFNQGLAKELIDTGEVFLLPEDEDDIYPERGTFVEHDRIATRRDWIIPVLTMGKVASKAIHATLKSLPPDVLPSEIYHIHQINEKTIMSNLPGLAHTSVGLSLKQLFTKKKNDLFWKFIVGMREPISCCLSSVFEIERRDLDLIDIKNLIYGRIYPFVSTWFDEQIKEPLDIDIFSHKFDKNKGYTIIREGNIEILLYRVESLTKNFSQVMEEFLGIPNLRLLKTNITSKKGYGSIYKRVKKDICFDAKFLDKVYSDKLANYFYTQEEISGFHKNWTKGAKKTLANSLASRIKQDSVKEINLNNASDYTYSKKSHFTLLDEKYSYTLYGKHEDIQNCDLKSYQDLLVFSFIKNNMPKGSKILEVGGGHSRLLEYFHNTYDCWHVDKFEGIGNWPIGVPDTNYKVVIDYIGNFNEEIPANYFDLVFSISVLEHIDPNDREMWNNILIDIDRVLKPGGTSLHCIDIALKGNTFQAHNIIQYIFNGKKTINQFIPLEIVDNDPDLFVMSERYYNKTWMDFTKMTYEEFGKPASYNIFWNKD